MSSIDTIFSSVAPATPEQKPKPDKPAAKTRPLNKKKDLLARRRAMMAHARTVKNGKKKAKKSKAKTKATKPAKRSVGRPAKKRSVGRPKAKRPIGRPRKSKVAKAAAKKTEGRLVPAFSPTSAKVEALGGVARAVGLLMQFGIKECLRQRLPASVILVAVGETAGLVASMMGVSYDQAVRAALSGIQGAYKGKPTEDLVEQARLLPGGI